MPPTPVPFRRVSTKDPELQQLQDSIAEALQRLAADQPSTGPRGGVSPSGPGAEVPIGCPIPWFKHLFPSTYELPPNWVECNGQTIVDTDSPLHGKVAPNINGDGRFIRGSATSGTLQAADAVTPAHVHDMGHGHADTFSVSPASHDHVERGALTGGGAPANRVRRENAINVFGDANTTTLTATAALSIAGSVTNMVGNTGSAGGSGSETRPINISAVYIMRIK